MPTASRAPGDGELRLCRWDSGWCNSQLLSASATREELRVPDSPHEVGRTGQRRGGQTNLWTLGPSTGAKLYSLLLHILVPVLAS